MIRIKSRVFGVRSLNGIFALINPLVYCFVSCILHFLCVLFQQFFSYIDMTINRYGKGCSYFIEMPSFVPHIFSFIKVRFLFILVVLKYGPGNVSVSEWRNFIQTIELFQESLPGLSFNISQLLNAGCSPDQIMACRKLREQTDQNLVVGFSINQVFHQWPLFSYHFR